MSSPPTEPASAPVAAGPRPPGPPAPAAAAEHPRLATRFGAGRMPGRFGVLVALIAAMVALLAGVVLATLTLAVPPGTARTAVTLLVQDVAFLSALVVVAVLAGPVRRRDVGLVAPPRPWLALGLSVVAFLAYLGLAALLLSLLGASDVTDTNPENLGITDGIVPALVVGSIATTLTPIAEEVVFRAVLFGALARSLVRLASFVGRNVVADRDTALVRAARRAVTPVAVGAAAVLVGGLFGIAHAGGTTPVLLLPLALFGIALCLLTWATRSIVPAIAVHALNNVFAVGSAAEFSPAGIAAFALGTFAVLGVLLLLLRVVGARVGAVGTAAAGPEIARI